MHTQQQAQQPTQAQPQTVAPAGGGPKKSRTGLVVVIVAAIVVVAAAATFLLTRSRSDETAATTVAPTTTAAPASTAAPATTAAPSTQAPSAEVAAEAESSDTIAVDDVYVDADGQVVVEGSTVTGDVGDVSVDVVNNSGVVTTIPVAITDIGGGKFHMNVDWSQVDVTTIFGGAGIGGGRGAAGLAGTHLELGSKANPDDNKAKITFVSVRSGAGAGAGTGAPVTTGGAPSVSRPGAR